MYADPVLTKYIELIKDKTSAIRTFYQGEPIRIGTSELPCCIISKTATAAGPLNNAEDQHQIGLRITIITDIRQDLSTEDSRAKMVEGISTLYEIMEGRNDNYTLKDTSILDILRSNLTVDAAHNLRTNLGSLTRIDYGTTMRDRSPEEWTTEARLEFEAVFLQDR